MTRHETSWTIGTVARAAVACLALAALLSGSPATVVAAERSPGQAASAVLLSTGDLRRALADATAAAEIARLRRPADLVAPSSASTGAQRADDATPPSLAGGQALRLYYLEAAERIAFGPAS